jgi:hypothetical protein
VIGAFVNWQQSGPEQRRIGSAVYTTGPPVTPSLSSTAKWREAGGSGQWISFERNGAAIIDEPKQVPTRRNMRACNPDGLIVEYAAHKANSSTEWPRKLVILD